MSVIMNPYPDGNRMIEELIEELKQLEPGKRISTAQLYRRVFPDAAILDGADMLRLHYGLIKAAQADGLTLDLSESDDMDVGMPFDLDYAVEKSMGSCLKQKGCAK